MKESFTDTIPISDVKKTTFEGILTIYFPETSNQ